MINLLPYEHKDQIRAARTNVILVRYIAILSVATLVLSGLVAGVYVTLNNTRAIAQQKVDENQQRTSSYQPIKLKADAFRADLATAKSIYDNNISFSKLIYQISGTIPPNVILDALPLDPGTFGSSMTLSANAKSFSDATKLRDAFKSNDQIFSNVQLQNIRTESGGGVYPVKITMSVVINKGAVQ